MNEKTLARKLKRLRKRNFLSVNEVAKILRDSGKPITIKSIYKWESGKAIPDLDMLLQLSYIYNTTMSYFFNDYNRLQALTDAELEFLTRIRLDKVFKKVLSLITKNAREENRIEHYSIA